MSDQIVFTTVRRKLSQLLPASYNPRKLTEKQHDDLKKSLAKFGLAEIPVINLDNTILAGHQRVLILAELEGLAFEIDVRIPNRQLTEEECKEYNIRSNKNGGSWDFDKLANEFDMADLLSWGFEDYELSVDADFSEEDFTSEEKKKALEDGGKKTCPHCGGEL